MSKEPTRLHITYSSPISDRELRKMVQAVEDTNVYVKTRRGSEEIVFECFDNFFHLEEIFDTLEHMAQAWEARGKNSGRWVDCVRSS